MTKEKNKQFKVYGTKDGKTLFFDSFESQAEADTYIGLMLMDYEDEGVSFHVEEVIEQGARK